MAIRAAIVLLASLTLASAAFATECVYCHAPATAATAEAPRWNGATQSSFAPAADVSDACLGCHDGTSARAMHVEGNHPVGVDYERLAVQRAASLRPSSSPSGLGGTIAEDLLINGRVECSSCHDPHAAHGSGTTRLRVSNQGSRLCLTCHER